MPIFVYEYDNGIKLYLFNPRISFTHRTGMLAVEPNSWERMVLISYTPEGTRDVQSWTPSPMLPVMSTSIRMIDKNGVDGVMWTGCKVDTVHGDGSAPAAPSRVMTYDASATGAPHELRPYYVSYAIMQYDGPSFII